MKYCWANGRHGAYFGLFPFSPPFSPLSFSHSLFSLSPAHELSFWLTQEAFIQSCYTFIKYVGYNNNLFFHTLFLCASFTCHIFGSFTKTLGFRAANETAHKQQQQLACLVCCCLPAASSFYGHSPSHSVVCRFRMCACLSKCEHMCLPCDNNVI